jgi:hypothetical protein
VSLRLVVAVASRSRARTRNVMVAPSSTEAERLVIQRVGQVSFP